MLQHRKIFRTQKSGNNGEVPAFYEDGNAMHSKVPCGFDVLCSASSATFGRTCRRNDCLWT